VGKPIAAVADHPTRSLVSPSQAIVMIAHRMTPRIRRHFARLRDEVGELMPAYLCMQAEKADAWQADFCVTTEDVERLLPARAEQARQVRGRINSGFTDLIKVPAMAHADLASFAYVWLMEYDVDYTGNWLSLFTMLGASDSDLIATYVLRPDQTPDWLHWQTLGLPQDCPPSSRLSAYLPLARISRPLCDAYLEEMRRPGWGGHIEALLPTVARHRGLSVIEVNDLATTSPLGLPVDRETYDYWPLRSQFYFGELPGAFKTPNRLYHPVKPAGMSR
jgi:hypothetical protein